MMVGSILGVGIFGIPYVVAQVGVALGLMEMIAVGGLVTVTILLYAELTLVRRTHGHFIRIIGGELGAGGRVVVGGAFVGSMWGAMLAYIVFGGIFLQTLLTVFLPVSVFQAQLIFLTVGALCVLGGVSIMARAQSVLLFGFVVLLALLCLLGLPYLNPQHLLTVNSAAVPSSLGVLLFAFGGFGLIPDIRDALHHNRRRLLGAVGLGMLGLLLLYAVLAVLVVAVTGAQTTVDPFVALGHTLGPAVTYVGAAMGLCSATVAFISVGVGLLETFLFDARTSLAGSWLLTIAPPLVVFLLGANSVLAVMKYSGGLLGAGCGILVLLAYERAKRAGDLPKQTLTCPTWLVGLLFALFMGEIMLTIFG